MASALASMDSPPHEVGDFPKLSGLSDGDLPALPSEDVHRARVPSRLTDKHPPDGDPMSLVNTRSILSHALLLSVTATTPGAQVGSVDSFVKWSATSGALPSTPIAGDAYGGGLENHRRPGR